MPAQTRVILHVDMDQFYAAVEVKRRPELRGKPVIVGSDPKQGRGRGVVSTASYEARKFGVKSAMPISLAWRLCPQGVFLPVDMAAYVAESGVIHQVFESMTPMVQPISLDEAFLDVTASMCRPRSGGARA
jgi:nucleotidyltransferase/DNA polymerase involved in DNA repair